MDDTIAGGGEGQGRRVSVDDAPAGPDDALWQPTDGVNVSVVARARAWLQRVLPRLVGQQPRRHLEDDTELLLCELVTNAVLHGGGVTGVRLRTADEVLRVTVCDRLTAPPVPRNPAAAAEHGRGIVLIEALATRWGVDRQAAGAGKCVWVELSTAPQRAIAA